MIWYEDKAGHILTRNEAKARAGAGFTVCVLDQQSRCFVSFGSGVFELWCGICGGLEPTATAEEALTSAEKHLIEEENT